MFLNCLCLSVSLPVMDTWTQTHTYTHTQDLKHSNACCFTLRNIILTSETTQTTLLQIEQALELLFINYSCQKPKPYVFNSQSPKILLLCMKNTYSIIYSCCKIKHTAHEHPSCHNFWIRKKTILAMQSILKMVTDIQRM